MQCSCGQLGSSGACVRPALGAPAQWRLRAVARGSPGRAVSARAAEEAGGGAPPPCCPAAAAAAKGYPGAAQLRQPADAAPRAALPAGLPMQHPDWGHPAPWDMGPPPGMRGPPPGFPSPWEQGRPRSRSPPRDFRGGGGSGGGRPVFKNPLQRREDDPNMFPLGSGGGGGGRRGRSPPPRRRSR